MDKIIDDIEKNNYLKDDLKKELRKIYQKYKGGMINEDEKQKLKIRVDEILESIFKTAFSYVIPMEFINSPLGNMLFKIKLDINNNIMYGIPELMIIANKSKQLISHDYHNGNLVAIEAGKNKRILMTEEEVYKYLISVGRNKFTPEEAKKRIQIFNKMNREGFSEDEIRNELLKYKGK